MQTKYEKAVGNPGQVYGRPEDVLSDEELSAEQKREVLKEWEAEAIHLQESAAEGFGGGERSRLDEIEAALSKLES
ncbi:hypothetical protein [Pelagicoccus sp. SDUM812003]|uniref:hypothetical protein n=1 Tax=Pelagicoccus sp. SDUM812003 TaxID=3041267 RepID=UPI00280CBD9E|nr:hypothetical protein [Pelagicoccus sp. SDUM812003]MDQ8201507.1 hypothetical protein [Pelagicoccus sp. SDUM812003]